MILVNVLVISVKTPVILLVELAELRVRGAIGAPGPGNTLGRGSYDLQLVGTSPSPLEWDGLQDYC